MSGPFDIFGLGADPDHPEDSPARKAQRASGKPLPKRFYDKVDIAEEDGGFLLHLDGRPVRTPAREIIKLDDKPVAEKLVEEWDAQEGVVNPKLMPLTRLVNSALDGVSQSMAEVGDEIVRFSGTDLLCYRADNPERLVELQTSQWGPVIAWAEHRYDCRFNLAVGVLHVAQPDETINAMNRVVTGFDSPLRLAALHSMTSLMGSCLLALAVADNHMSADHAWKIAHLDEDWNIEQWGGDHDAEVRREYRWKEMKAAAFLAAAAR
ncbi:MAG: ATP12 family protein [Hyphomicrobiales bacterium]